MLYSYAGMMGAVWSYGYIYTNGTTFYPLNAFKGEETSPSSAYGAFRSHHPGGAHFSLAEPNLNEVRLTTEIWLRSTDEQKFSPEILARLRREDSGLKSSASWNEFYNGQVKPAFRETYGLAEATDP